MVPGVTVVSKEGRIRQRDKLPHHTAARELWSQLLHLPVYCSVWVWSTESSREPWAPAYSSHPAV